ncbi:MAG: hypothetical protein Q7S40_32820 [Opitutaceae bacterium]|nr:hypothetical protein [Opitutaceae bacterium]
MQLRYADDFVEGAVFICANRRRCGPPPLQIRRFHLAREKLYSILDPDARNTAFFNLQLEWFREWGLEKMLVGPADEFPLLRRMLNALVFRRARIQRDEGAELYVGPENGRSGVVALRIERFDRPDELACFLRHEFAHVNDMLDPAFGYSPEVHLPGRNAAQQRLTRERYRLLWDIAIDGRLTAASRATLGGREQHRVAFDHVFGFWPESRRNEVFDALWVDRQPRHADLLAIASDPRGLDSTHEPVPGAACPLCGFATFAWAGAHGLSAPTRAAICAEFPHWAPDQGACRRCVEIYRIVGARTPLAV